MTGNTQAESIPTALYGPKTEITVKLEGESCSAILDTGSQVTVIFEQYYMQHLLHLPLQPLSALSVWWYGQYLYLWYIMVCPEIPEDAVGVWQPLDFLALVCPDTSSPSESPCFIGTNSDCKHASVMILLWVLQNIENSQFVFRSIEQKVEGALMLSPGRTYWSHSADWNTACGYKPTVQLVGCRATVSEEKKKWFWLKHQRMPCGVFVKTVATTSHKTTAHSTPTRRCPPVEFWWLCWRSGKNDSRAELRSFFHLWMGCV